MNSSHSLPVGTVILGEVIDAIAVALTTYAPERGGLLFGPKGQKLITHFVSDDDAEHHSVTYTPSASICARSPEIEREHGLEYKGVIHSHPGSMDRPSSPDVTNARKALTRNAHLSYFMMPIVTLGKFDEETLASHELLIPGGKLSQWIVPQSATPQDRKLSRERITRLSLWDDLRKLTSSFAEPPTVGRCNMLDIEGVSAAAYSVRIKEEDWMFAAAAGYPFTPPLVVPPLGDLTSVPLSWDLEVAADERLISAVRPLMKGMSNPLVSARRIQEAPSIEPLPAKRGGRARRRLMEVCTMLALACAVGSFSGTFLANRIGSQPSPSLPGASSARPERVDAVPDPITPPEEVPTGEPALPPVSSPMPPSQEQSQPGFPNELIPAEDFHSLFLINPPSEDPWNWEDQNPWKFSSAPLEKHQSQPLE